jgi:hypothetical protein
MSVSSAQPTYDRRGMTPEFEGRYSSPKYQWWVTAAHMTTDDGMPWDIYIWPTLGSLDETWLTALYTPTEMIDLTSHNLPTGSFTVSGRGVDVRYGNNFFSGSFPRYETHVEGEKDGEPVSVDMTLDAESPPFQAVPHLTGISWWLVPTMKATVVIKRGGKTFSGTGHGYMERRRGRFWSPVIKQGVWETLPIVSGGELTVPLIYKVWRRDGSAQLQTLTFSSDHGQTIIDMPEVEMEFLKTDRFPGFEMVDHPTDIRVTARGENMEAELEVIRNPNRLMLRNFLGDPHPESDAIGMYGPSHHKGHVRVGDKRYDIDGRGFGSALFFGTEGKFQR